MGYIKHKITLYREQQRVFLTQPYSFSSIHTILSPAVGRIILAEGGGNGSSMGSMARAINR